MVKKKTKKITVEERDAHGVTDSIPLCVRVRVCVPECVCMCARVCMWLHAEVTLGLWAGW